MVRPVGWRFESARHALAAKGMKTGRRYMVWKPLAIVMDGRIRYGKKFYELPEDEKKMVERHERKHVGIHEKLEGVPEYDALNRREHALAKKLVWRIAGRELEKGRTPSEDELVEEVYPVARDVVSAEEALVFDEHDRTAGAQEWRRDVRDLNENEEFSDIALERKRNIVELKRLLHGI